MALAQHHLPLLQTLNKQRFSHIILTLFIIHKREIAKANQSVRMVLAQQHLPLLKTLNMQRLGLIISTLTLTQASEIVD
jgi:hypothetical protein